MKVEEEQPEVEGVETDSDIATSIRVSFTDETNVSRSIDVITRLETPAGSRVT